MSQELTTPAHVTRDKKFKCVVWDLDNTLWQGILLEGAELSVPSHVSATLQELDQRGILQSIASKNDFDNAFKQLQKLKLDHYFIYPQINWGPKSQSIKKIAEAINIGIDTILFVDDQEFERDEVAADCPQVSVVDESQIFTLLLMPELMPRFITDESNSRRLMYQQDILRNQVEESFAGPKDEFLASLGMVFSVTRARPADLKRLEELVARTNQLNTTGRIYSYEELDYFSTHPDYELLTCSLTDKYGSYGKIGLALIEKKQDCWSIKSFLLSCRVMSRGVGKILLQVIVNRAGLASRRLLAEIVHNEKNRIMYMTYRFAGFKTIVKEGSSELLEQEFTQEYQFPDFVALDVEDDLLTVMEAESV
jgi:FkbH-like protein